MKNPDNSLWSELYSLMFKSRYFEQSVAGLWHKGHIFGEMHLGMGEEAIVAGILSHLIDGDAMALDHRGTPPLLMRGIDMAELLKEFLGYEDGLCSGYGGHMHLFSKEHLIASSGIVGAAAPAAIGFALAGRKLRPGTISVAFMGEGAMNQGMVMESFNLAAVWKLPVLFVCKDNDWSITTVSSSVTAGKLIDRVKAFTIPSYEIDGTNIEEVWSTAQSAIREMRENKHPCFIHAHCIHLEGHFLGDPLIEIMRHPAKKTKKIASPLIKSTIKFDGGSAKERINSLKTVSAHIGKSARDHLWKPNDPIQNSRRFLEDKGINTTKIEQAITNEVDQIVKDVLLSGERQ